MKKVYFYNPKTFEYTGESEARLDVEATKKFGKEIYAEPMNATFIEVPKLKDFQIAVFDIHEGVWNVKASYKGNYKWNKVTGVISQITTNEPLKSFEVLVNKDIVSDVLENPIKYDVIDGEVVDISEMQLYQNKYNIRKYKKLIQEAKEAYTKFQETPVKFEGMEFLPRYIEDYAKLSGRSFPMEIWDCNGTKSKLMSEAEFNRLKSYLETLDNRAYQAKKNAIKKYKIEIEKLERKDG